MPASERSLRLTDAYQTQLVALREGTSRIVRAQWRLDPNRLDASFREWLDSTVAVTTAAQQLGVRTTDAYLGAYLSSELDVPVPSPVLPIEEYAGQTRDGRPLRDELVNPILTVKTRIAQGAPFDQAQQMGLNRGLRSVSFAVVEAARRAAADTIRSDSRIVGYRRVARGGGCGACLAAATGAIHPDAQVMPVHRGCVCVKEPVVAHVREHAERPTGKEMFDQLDPAAQDRLFAGRGGADKAELVRSGAVPFDALITRDPEVLGADGITETPLAELTATAR